MSKTREYTNKILELVDDGIVDKDWLIQALLLWMSESDVAEFYDRELRPDDEEEWPEDEETDEDYEEDFNSVGSRHHY